MFSEAFTIIKNAPNTFVRGENIQAYKYRKTCAFFHPDFHGRYRNLTGSCAEALADFTAGREFHPALKTCSIDNIYPCTAVVNP